MQKTRSISQPGSRKSNWSIIGQAREEVEERMMGQLVSSMPNSFFELIKNSGGHTRY